MQSNLELGTWNLERLCLIGFMGAGKTTVGAELAIRLGVDFVDLDSFIEQRERCSVAEIFAASGEAKFREIEQNLLLEVAQTNGNLILALGGGAWTFAANRRIIAAHGFRAVWLDADFELCWQRICAQTAARPLARNKDAARELFEQRRAVYESADLTVNVTENAASAEIGEQILIALKPD